MKIIIILLASIFCVSCTSQKNVPAQTANTNDSANEAPGSNETKAATPTKSIILNNTESAGSNETKAATRTKTIILNNSEATEKGMAKKKESSNGSGNLPACLQILVKSFLAEDVQNPPRQIYSYMYKGKLVYYVTPPCCDFFSDLYDAQCKLIAHPDGGITGTGDGRAKDFSETKSQEKLVWEDARKKR